MGNKGVLASVATSVVVLGAFLVVRSLLGKPAPIARASIRILDIPDASIAAISPNGKWVGIDGKGNRCYLAAVAEYPNRRLIPLPKPTRSGYPRWSISGVTDEGAALLVYSANASSRVPRLWRPGGKVESLAGWPEATDGHMGRPSPRGDFIGTTGRFSGPGDPGTRIDAVARNRKGVLQKLPYDEGAYSGSSPLAQSWDGSVVYGQLHQGMNACVAVWRDRQAAEVLTPTNPIGNVSMACSADGGTLFLASHEGITVIRDRRPVDVIANPPLPSAPKSPPSAPTSSGITMTPFPPAVLQKVVACNGEGSLLVGELNYMTPSYTVAFVWDKAHGRVELETLLSESGVTRTWVKNSLRARAMDGMGKRIAGSVDRGGHWYPAIVDLR